MSLFGLNIVEFWSEFFLNWFREVEVDFGFDVDEVGSLLGPFLQVFSDSLHQRFVLLVCENNAQMFDHDLVDPLTVLVGVFAV